MKKRGIFNVNEERLKEFMANGTDAEGTPKTPFAEEKTTRETDIFPVRTGRCRQTASCFLRTGRKRNLTSGEDTRVPKKFSQP